VAAAQRHLVVTLALLAPPVLFFAGMNRFPSNAPEVPGGSASVIATSFTIEPESPPEWMCMLAAVWLLGAIVSVSKTIIEAQRWRAVAHRAEDRGLFSLSDEICEPMVTGILAPRILLPARGYIENLTREELETVFAHEEEHVARRDNLIALVTELASSLFWFDPIQRLARRRAVELRERACDEAVLAQGCSAEPYVAALAKSCRGALHTPAVACMSRIRFRERMDSIMNFDRDRLFPLSSWTVRGTFVAVLIVAAAAFAVLAPPSSFALDETDAQYDLSARARKTPEGKFSVVTVVKSPDGGFTSATEFPAAPDTRVVTSNVGTREYKTTIRLNADGSGTATLEVLDGPRTVARRERTFEGFTIPPPVPDGYKKVGGTVKAPQIVTSVEPVYTPEAKANRIAGIVILEVLIGDTGAVNDVRVLKPLPFGLDQAAVDAVKQWKFLPGTVDGAPVPVSFNITINFKLDE
jgi:TonB family protein